MIEVRPYDNICAVLKADGDKSITVRALLLGAIASGETKIFNPLFSKDTENAVRVAKQLGASVTVDKKNALITVVGSKGIPQNQRFYCGNSGTLARLLIGLLAGANVKAVVCGDKSLSSRPMDRVIKPLSMRGAQLVSTSGKLPVRVYPARLNDLEYRMEVDSAQVKSALLLSGLISGKKTVIIENNPTRDHTEQMLAYMGARVVLDGNRIELYKSEINGKNIEVLSDPSSASYYLALGLLKGEVTVNNLLQNHLRNYYLKKLSQCGAKFSYENGFSRGGFSGFSVTAYKSEIDFIEIKQGEVSLLIDELPLLAVIACLSRGAIMHGVGELRVKESDRLSGIVQLVTALGGKAEVVGDDLKIQAAKNFNRATFESDDHRMIMCAHVGFACANGGIIKGEKNVQISFKGYFKNLEKNVFGLIGNNVSKSLSGIIHKHVLSSFGLENFSYECKSIAKQYLDEFFKKCPYKAINVTIPYKKSVQSYIEKQDKSSKLAKSVNFVKSGVGYSLDGEALLLCLLQNEIDLKNCRVLVYGVGGAGRSIAVSLARAGVSVKLINRTQSVIDEFLQGLPKAYDVAPYSGEACDVIINATCVTDRVLFSEKQIKNCRLAVDVNYKKDIALKQECEALGVKFIDGLQMLFYQAYFADCKILRIKPDLQAAVKSYKAFKEKYENLCN